MNCTPKVGQKTLGVRFKNRFFFSICWSATFRVFPIFEEYLIVHFYTSIFNTSQHFGFFKNTPCV